ncbi:MAG: MFS transporter [Chloroflexi bacterium]|nr:MAG: MFS transporter [Chloroflexota bacterium]TMD73081.1 MAG: MFS transporter [Chloroflexota bacterium]
MIPEDDESLTVRPPRRWWHLATVDITPLRRHRDFRLLFIGRFVSFFGSMITVVAFPYQVYQLTHSVLLVGLLGVLEFAAILAVAFVGGALADARDRRSMVLLSEVALMVCSLVLAGNAAIPHPQVWLLFVVATAWGALDAVQRPSLDAMLPRLVDKNELTAAAALGSIRGTLGQILGPALGGVLVAAIGLSFTYMVDVATFVVGLACLWLMRSVPPPVNAERPSFRRVLEGLRYARSRQELLGTYFVDMIAMFFGMPMALFPAIAQGLGGPKVLGLLYAAPAIGSFAFSATSGWTNRIHRHGMGVAVAAVVWGLAIIGFGFATSLWLAVLFLVVAGAADMMSGVFRSVIWNQTIPDSLRGRLASIEMLSYTSGPALGNFEAGAVASIFNVRISIVSGGVLCVIGCVLCALALPAFRAYDARLYHLAPDPAAGSVKREKQ